jgi:hypothetical protein
MEHFGIHGPKNQSTGLYPALLPPTLAGLHVVVSAILILKRFVEPRVYVPNTL